MKTLIVPVSGGKDSQVCLSLALTYVQRKPGWRVVAVHQNTGFDHPLTYRHLGKMTRFYGVPVVHTRSARHPEGMFGFLKRAQYFPNPAARGCTQELKQKPFAAWLRAEGYTAANSLVWFGMRSEESRDRNAKYGNLRATDRLTLSEIAWFYAQGSYADVGALPCRLPVVNWSTQRVFAYLHKEGAPINPLYARGHTRVGCYPCLLSRKAEWQAAARDPVGRQHLHQLVRLEDRWAREGNPRKYIKVHRVWDVREFLRDGGKALPEAEGECGWCSI